ncbi:unnamed protein product [Brassica napus]|uniref:(rape) hypothetical protein n=1 Tax=Brassica napus TaxID=3708 RepID=A0A817AXH6_BRANA|nr:unnamed protein product [Brassica napus]
MHLTSLQGGWTLAIKSDAGRCTSKHLPGEIEIYCYFTVLLF